MRRNHSPKLTESPSSVPSTSSDARAAELRAAFDSLPIGIAVVDSVGVIVLCNKLWMSAVGSKLLPGIDVSVGSHLLDALAASPRNAPDNAGSLARRIRSVIEGQRREDVIDLPVPGSDREHWLRIQINPISSSSLNGCIVSTTNISGQKRIERNLRASKHELAEAQRIAHLGSWVLDIQTNKLTWSDETYRIFGFPKTRDLGRYEDFAKCIHPEDRPHLEAARRKALAGDGPFHSEHRIVRPDGEERIIRERGELIRDRRGRPARLAGTALDITDLRKADQALRESEKRFRTLIENSLNLIYLKDPDGRFLLANRELETAFCARPGSLVGKTDYDIMPRASANRLRRNDKVVIDTSRPLRVQETVDTPDGARTYLSIKFPLISETGSISAIGGISTDITDLKRTERTLRDSEAALRGLTARLESVREEERVRISREIHDELGQLLTGLKMEQSLLSAAFNQRERMPTYSEVRSDLASIGRLADAALDAVRRIAAELRPEELAG